MPIIEREYDKLTGLIKTTAVEDGKYIVHTAQDLEPHAAMTKARREDESYTKMAIKNNLLPAVHLPDVVCHEIKNKYGFDVYNSSALELRLFLRKHRSEYNGWFMTDARI
jgi:hypothetical protein